MGCATSKAAKPKPVRKARQGGRDTSRDIRRHSDASFDSLDLDRSKKNGSYGSCENNSELSDEETEILEKEQRELIWAEKANLRDRVHTENMMAGEYVETASAEKSVLDLLKQEEEMTAMNNNAIRLQKQTRRRLLKRRAEKEQKWMVFTNSECFDEADMNTLTDFLTKVMNNVPQDSLLDPSCAEDSAKNRVSEKKNFGAVNAIADYLSLTVEESLTSGERSNNLSTDIGDGDKEGDDTITLIKRRSKSNLKMDMFPSVSAAVGDIESKSDKSSASNNISLLRNGSCNAKELVQMVRSASLSRMDGIAGRSNSADMSANSSSRKKSDEEVIQVFRSYSTDAVMVCDPDSLISLNRESSKSRLMGMNIHPSRKTEVEKKDENEDLIAIKNASRHSSECSYTSTTSLKDSVKGEDTKENFGVLTHTAINALNSTESNSNLNITDNFNGNFDTDKYPVEKSKLSSLLSISSNLNLLEGDLPQTMLDNFDIPSGPITPSVAAIVMNVLKQGGRLSFKSAHKILRISYKHLSELPNTTKCDVGPNDRLTVVGDIHGQLPDLIHILEDSGFPSVNNKYVFNGDFVDRGPRGVEVMLLLLALFVAFPRGTVVLNRGNHEDYAICCAYGFQVECFEKYDDITFGMFIEVFGYLPLFAIINSAILVVHGGIFHTQDALLSELNAINRAEFSLRDMPEGGEKLQEIPRFKREEYLKQLARDALWSDPVDTPGIEVNVRGAGVSFGPDRVITFLEVNQLKMIVRSHECVRTGFDHPYTGVNTELLCTIFSASNYGGGGNSGAYMVFSKDPKLNISVALGDCNEACQRTGTDLVRVVDTDLYYSVYFFDIAFNEDDINENVNYDSDYEESLLLSSAYLDQKYSTESNLESKQENGLPSISPSPSKDNSTGGTGGGIESATIGGALVGSLYQDHKRLAEVFRYFDIDNSGLISKTEFLAGCERLNKALSPENQLGNLDTILDIMDINGSHTIDLNSFFELFRLADMHSDYSLIVPSPAPSFALIQPSADNTSARKFSMQSPGLSPLILPIAIPNAHILDRADSLAMSQSGNTPSRSCSMPSPRLVSLGSSSIPLIDRVGREGSSRRVRSLSTQQQTVISAEGEAALVLQSVRHNSLESAVNHPRKNSLDNSSHGFFMPAINDRKNNLDYSFHGSEQLDDAPDDVYEMPGSARYLDYFSNPDDVGTRS